MSAEKKIAAEGREKDRHNINNNEDRFGDEERRLMHLVPAPAVRLMKRRVLSRPGVNSLMVHIFHTPGLLLGTRLFRN